MFLPFESMAPNSRIWIYQADRALTEENKIYITDFMRQYCDEWQAHGQPLKASFRLAYDYFLILAVDEDYNEASGCSIDTSVKAVREVSDKTGIDFFNRQMVAFKVGQHISLSGLKDLKKNLQDGIWNEQSLAFNNTVTEKRQLDTEWLRPANQTWLARYIPGLSIKT
jgi:hypothetical protein